MQFPVNPYNLKNYSNNIKSSTPKEYSVTVPAFTTIHLILMPTISTVTLKRKEKNKMIIQAFFSPPKREKWKNIQNMLAKL
jgi:predicted PurR-regulated permease PerM